jgi:pimeloyl-ACP methyl ester carboxylesterase
MKKRLLIACLVLLSAVSTTHAYVEVKDNLIVPLDDRAVREAIFKAQLAKVNQQNVLLRYELVRAQYDGQAVSGDFHSNDSSYDTNNIKELAMIYQYNVTKQMNGAINSKMDARFAYRNEQLKDIRPESARAEEWFNSLNTYYDSVEVGADVFDAVKAKTLVLAGEKDANAPLQTVIDAYHLLPDAELGIVPNAPHPVLTTDFDQAWPMIEKFLAK